MSLVHHLGEADRGYIDPADPGEPAGPGAGRRRVSVTDEEGALLWGLTINRSVLEIGTGLGVATRWIAQGARVTTVDVDPWVHEHIWPTLPADVHRSSGLHDLEHPYGMVFIDGEHTDEALTKDIAFAKGILIPGEMIVVHDAIELRATLKADEGKWYILDTRYGLGIHVVT